MLVRVRHAGWEYDTGASHAEANGLEVIATDVRPTPPTRVADPEAETPARPRSRRGSKPADPEAETPATETEENS